MMLPKSIRPKSSPIKSFILLNRDWLKNSDIRKSLVTHPKTPLPKAIRFIGSLTADELKKLAKSRSVSTAIVTTARKELENRLKRSGG